MNVIEEDDIDHMNEEVLRDFTRRLITSLRLAEEDGVFGNDSWEGYLEIEV